MMDRNEGRTRPIRIGIIGCGNVMDGAYMPEIENLRRHQGSVEVLAACHRTTERGRKICAKWGIPNFSTDYREVLRSPEIDLVLVLTSMREHGEITRTALEAGKHVLVEKPLATMLEEAEDLLRLAARSRGHLVCAPFVILSPTFQAIAKRVRRGDIGKVLTARARYGWSGPDWGRWFYESGGGCIFDLAVYNITSLTALLGPAQRVAAMAGVAIPERLVASEKIKVSAEDNAHILMDFGNSVFAVVSTGFTMQKYRSPAIELYGREGTLQILGDDWAPNGYELWQNSVGAWQVFEEKDPSWSWTSGLHHLVDCIARNRKPLVTPEHAVHVLEIMLAAQASGRDGRAREIRSAFTPPAFEEESGESLPAHRIHDPRRGAEK